ncbi:coiled-coil domain-containing protein 153 [Alligator sinensis]|uniref:Dynein regulatory complex protein 12 n=1 Tax=Alligator sinensis TaxID=38654 RepID=A0A3Q0GVF6_ALLSI|nr:coiled-coil domain-containing protein 153 [Alligator sinensis]
MPGQLHFLLEICSLACKKPFASRQTRSMAPKAKGKGKKGGRQKKTQPAAAGEAGESRKTALEVDTLRRHLVLRRDVARQAEGGSGGGGAGAGEGLQLRLQELEQELEAERDDKRDIYEEMIRQYQELQRQTETRIQCLEAEVTQLQEQLAACRQESQQAREESERMLGEKDRSLTELQAKIDTMKTEYEQILHGSLDGVLAKLASAKLRWEREATAIHMEHKERLRDFGLNPLEM